MVRTAGEKCIQIRKIPFSNIAKRAKNGRGFNEISESISMLFSVCLCEISRSKDTKFLLCASFVFIDADFSYYLSSCENAPLSQHSTGESNLSIACCFLHFKVLDWIRLVDLERKMKVLHRVNEVDSISIVRWKI